MHIRSQAASLSTRQSVCLLLKNWCLHSCLARECLAEVFCWQSEPGRDQSLACCRKCPKTTASSDLKSFGAQHRRRRLGSRTPASLRVICCFWLIAESSSSGVRSSLRNPLRPAWWDSRRYLRRRCSKHAASSSDWVESSWVQDAPVWRRSHLKSNNGFPDWASPSLLTIYEASSPRPWPLWACASGFLSLQVQCSPITAHRWSMESFSVWKHCPNLKLCRRDSTRAELEKLVSLDLSDQKSEFLGGNSCSREFQLKVCF